MKERQLLLWLIAGYVAVAAIAWPEVYAGLVTSYAAQLGIIPVALLILLPAVAILVQPRAPLAYVRDLLLLRNGMRFVVVAIIFCVGIAAFTTYKLAIPHLVPFYADPGLADLDFALHGGHNPGEIANAIVPSEARYLLGVLYGPIWFVLWFGLIAFVALSEDKALRRRYFWAMALTVAVLGTGLAAVFSSVGPILYERIYQVDRFARLVSLIEQGPVGDYMKLASGYLYDAYINGGASAGAGISAMPSMHLAIATLNALMLTGVNRMVGTFAWAFVAVILVGSVYLGWHYAIDGYVSIAAVSLIWAVVGRLQRHGRTEPDTAPAMPTTAVAGAPSEI